MIEKKKTINLDSIPNLEIGVVEAKQAPYEADIEPQSLQFRIEIKRSRTGGFFFPIVIVLVLLGSLGALSAALRYDDDFREETILMVKQLAKDAKSTRMGNVSRTVLASVSHALKAHRPVKVQVAAEPVTNSFGTCSAFIRDAINKKVKTANLSDAEFIHLINCEMFQDSPRLALQSLDKKGVSLALGTRWDMMPTSLLALEANRRMNPLSPLPIFPKQGCLRWGASADCMLRYVDESRAAFKSRWQDGFKALEKDVAKQGGNVIAWFYLASSYYATKDAEFTKADSFLQTAFIAIKDQPNPFLEREIYRVATVNAYLSKDSKLAAKALSLMPVKRVEEAPNAFLDVEMLEQLHGRDSKKLLQAYLMQSEAVKRFASDPRFLSIILAQTQRYELEKEGLTFATQVFGKSSEVKPESIGESMMLMYARMLIGADKSFEALEMLTQMEKAGYRSAELYHLRGLAQLLAFKKPEIKLLAAKDFQSAAALNKNEQSLFALIVALLDAKERAKVDQVMNQWKALGPNSQKSVWFGLAQGLVSYTGGNKDQAQAIWDQSEKLNKADGLWARLRLNLSTDSSYLDRDLAKSLSGLLTSDSPLGSLALFGQKS
jgi:hypothetical protein